MDMTCFHRRLFARLPSQHHTMELILPVVEQIQSHRTLFKAESFLRLLSQQHIAGHDNCADDPSRWAIVNTFFAKSILYRTSNESINGMSPTAWSYFKNAFAMFPELMIQGEEISACEAILAMSMFTLGSGDARTTSQLTAAAARLAHGLGLHRKDHYPTLDAGVAERHRQVFWVAYVLNTEVMHRYGLPSPFRDDAVAVDLPQDSALRHRAGLAVIQLRIYGLLHSNTSTHTSSVGPLDAVFATYQDLQVWKSMLPEHMQPRGRYSGEMLDIPLATLHYTFYSCVAKIHMIMARLMSPKLFECTKDVLHGMKDMNPSAELTRNLCAASARSILNVLRCLAPHPFFQLWYVETLCYPLSAIYILLLAILEDPTGQLAEPDVELIQEFVRFLERLQEQGCDVGSLLDGCIKLHWVALCAINASHVGRQLCGSDQGMAERVTWAQLESIRLKLSNVTDWLQLAQGLLSNIPRLRMESEEVLSDIFGTQPTNGVYGLFVPEFLKSCSYNLSFGD
ncbi:fungal-specific transcription factor domain-containing protein [Phaeosphaeriaceae sp. PMI808]|nr:fungal-specific transcription factor domain-containing protein [Phaeosphaeriaceae sp. PMI808]